MELDGAHEPLAVSCPTLSSFINFSLALGEHYAQRDLGIRCTLIVSGTIRDLQYVVDTVRGQIDA